MSAQNFGHVNRQSRQPGMLVEATPWIFRKTLISPEGRDAAARRWQR
jgi:hypothetical protein